MLGQDTPKTNVVSLFQKKTDAAAQAASSGDEKKDEESFDDVMTRNAKNAERVAKERANANKSVLRSYRIKQ